MTGWLALDLSSQRITLLGDAGTGWFRIGDVRFGSAHFAEGVTRLRQVAAAVQSTLAPDLDAEAPSVLLVLPEAQVTWRRIAPGSHGDALALDLSPERMRLDVRRLPEALAVAAVPLDTLAEAESYVSDLGFTPLASFAPGPQDSGFDTAWFGALAEPTVDGVVASRPPGPPVALDRRRIAAHPPAELGEALAADKAARQRAEAAARIDPAHLNPLEDAEDASSPRQLRATRLGFPAAGRMRRAGRIAALTAGLAAAIMAVAYFTDVPAPDGPDSPERTAAAPAGAVEPDSLAQPQSQIVRAAPEQPAPQISVDPAADTPAPRIAEAAEAERLPLGPSMGYYTPSRGLTGTVPPEVAPADVLDQPGLDPALGADALALTAASIPGTDDRPAALDPPPSAELRFVVDERGLVLPVPSGALSPDGHLVYAGRPPSVPAWRSPEDAEAALAARPPPVTDRATLAETDPLRWLDPKRRPDGLAERFERAQLGGRTTEELSDLRPAVRPDSIQDAVTEAAAAPTQFAVNAGPRPPKRPSGLSARPATSASAAVAAASTAAVATAARAPAAAASPSPSRAVAPPVQAAPATTGPKSATDPNRIDLSSVNLLGTFGRGGSLRALVRMPDGDVVNVAVGDRIDGGRVQTIASGQLTYVKRGKAVTLRMPKG